MRLVKNGRGTLIWLVVAFAIASGNSDAPPVPVSLVSPVLSSTSFQGLDETLPFTLSIAVAEVFMDMDGLVPVGQTVMEQSDGGGVSDFFKPPRLTFHDDLRVAEFPPRLAVAGGSPTCLVHDGGEHGQARRRDSPMVSPSSSPQGDALGA